MKTPNVNTMSETESWICHQLSEVEFSRTSLASRTFSRTHFEVLGLKGQVLGLGLEASSPRKLACPRLEDSTIFWIVKILWSACKIFWKTCFCGDRLKNFCEDLFVLFFFLRSPEKFLWGPFFFGEHLRLCPWSLALASSLVSSTPPLSVMKWIFCLLCNGLLCWFAGESKKTLQFLHDLTLSSKDKNLAQWYLQLLWGKVSL